MENEIKCFKERLVWILVFGFWIFPLSGFAAPPPAPPVPRIHFNSNHFEILESERPLLDQNVRWLKANPKAVLILEGHCDAWGESNYNLQLGDLRAREVKTYLIEQGIDAERMIMVVSYGEQKPLDVRSVKEAWATNRRVEFVLR